MEQDPNNEGPIVAQETVALSPVENSFASFDDLASLFGEDVTSLKTLTTLQSSSAIFSAGNFGDPRPPEVATDTTHTDLDTVFLDVLLNNKAELVQETTPLCSDASATSSEAPSPLSVSTSTLECTNENNVVDPLDIPFLTQNCDLTNFIDTIVNDPPLTRTCTPEMSPMFSNTVVEDTLETSSQENLVLSDCLRLFPDSLDQTVIDMSDSELNQLFNVFPPQETLSSESQPTTPLPQVPSEVQTSLPTNSRKRKLSDAEPVDVLQKKNKLEEKQIERRIKNNAASRVSRAKRRERHTTVFSKVDELEEENAKLKVEAEKLEIEITKIKKLLVDRLSK